MGEIIEVDPLEDFELWLKLKKHAAQQYAAHRGDSWKTWKAARDEKNRRDEIDRIEKANERINAILAELYAGLVARQLRDGE